MGVACTLLWVPCDLHVCRFHHSPSLLKGGQTALLRLDFARSFQKIRTVVRSPCRIPGPLAGVPLPVTLGRPVSLFSKVENEHWGALGKLLSGRHKKYHFIVKLRWDGVENRYPLIQSVLCQKGNFNFGK